MIYKPCSINLPPRIQIGYGSISLLVDEVIALQGNNAAIITDKSIVKASIIDNSINSLKRNNKLKVIIDDVIPEVPIDKVEEIANKINAKNIDLIVGVGGGSCLDTAKLVAMLQANGGNIRDYLGIDLVPNKSTPLILIPTTAGTGSEVTSAAVVSDKEEGTKKAVLSTKIIAESAIVDPQLTVTCPKFLTAITGIDALVHAVEAYTSVKASAASDMFALEAFQLIFNNIKDVYYSPDNKEARFKLSYGSMLAGIAFGNSSTAAVHGLAYPLGGMFNISHGLSNSLMFPEVLRYNIPACTNKLATLMKKILPGEVKSERQLAQSLLDEIILLVNDLNLPVRLRQLDIQENDIEALARAGYNNQRLLANNPRVLDFDAVYNIYQNTY